MLNERRRERCHSANFSSSPTHHIIAFSLAPLKHLHLRSEYKPISFCPHTNVLPVPPDDEQKRETQERTECLSWKTVFFSVGKTFQRRARIDLQRKYLQHVVHARHTAEHEDSSVRVKREKNMAFPSRESKSKREKEPTKFTEG